MAEYFCSRCGYQKLMDEKRVGFEMECPICQTVNPIIATTNLRPSPESIPYSFQEMNDGKKGFSLLLAAMGISFLVNLIACLMINMNSNKILPMHLNFSFGFGGFIIMVLVIGGLFKLNQVDSQKPWKKAIGTAIEGYIIHGIFSYGIFFLLLLWPNYKLFKTILFWISMASLTGFFIYTFFVLKLIHIVGEKMGLSSLFNISQKATLFLKLLLICLGILLGIIVIVFSIFPNILSFTKETGGIFLVPLFMVWGLCIIMFISLLIYFVLFITALASARIACKNALITLTEIKE